MAVSRRKAEARRRNYNELKARISKLSVPRVEKNRFSQVLSRITKVIPATVTFDVISFNNKIGMISGIATGPKDLPYFVKNLKKEPVFKDVALLNIARDFADDNQYRLFFNIKFELM
ncbi:MAG: PilN domain-containing protein [Thermodesulfobacteriota bacterium]|nr:PilN domain-containing protein [Thermodesulfobacteriota bacterium]